MQSTFELLKIPSPTGDEGQIFQHIKAQILQSWPNAQFLEWQNSLIAKLPTKAGQKNISLVGHIDVVPNFFMPYEKDGLLYGAGASDMKGSLGVYLQLLTQHGEKLCQNHNVSLVFYEKEEQTPMVENGLYALLQKFPEYFKSLDLAIVGEPTDLQVHLGCMGSLHAEFTIQGKACHSARPWNGENAIYKALPFLENISHLPNTAHEICGVVFQDVVQVTELSAEPGRTSLPGWVKGNVNFRFAPVYSTAEAEIILANHFQAQGLKKDEYRFLDVSPAAQVIETDFFKAVLAKLAQPLKAKQAWTDVAQLAALGVPAFNFGAGLTEQAHKTNEMIPLVNLQKYFEMLQKLLLEDFV